MGKGGILRHGAQRSSSSVNPRVLSLVKTSVFDGFTSSEGISIAGDISDLIDADLDTLEESVFFKEAF
ncbi:MAG: hypothetical protein Q8924_19805, partial [Bacillota bacterium]|nr:hypothetical protein [Bacillota bacterium]